MTDATTHAATCSDMMDKSETWKCLKWCGRSVYRGVRTLSVFLSVANECDSSNSFGSHPVSAMPTHEGSFHKVGTSSVMTCTRLSNTESGVRHYLRTDNNGSNKGTILMPCQVPQKPHRRDMRVLISRFFSAYINRIVLYRLLSRRTHCIFLGEPFPSLTIFYVLCSMLQHLELVSEYKSSPQPNPLYLLRWVIPFTPNTLCPIFYVTAFGAGLWIPNQVLSRWTHCTFWGEPFPSLPIL